MTPPENYIQSKNKIKPLNFSEIIEVQTYNVPAGESKKKMIWVIKLLVPVDI